MWASLGEVITFSPRKAELDMFPRHVQLAYTPGRAPASDIQREELVRLDWFRKAFPRKICCNATTAAVFAFRTVFVFREQVGPDFIEARFDLPMSRIASRIQYRIQTDLCVQDVIGRGVSSIFTTMIQMVLFPGDSLRSTR